MTEKQKLTSLKRTYFRLFCAEQIALRYKAANAISINKELIDECIDVISDLKTSAVQKRAARVILNLKYGAEKTNELIEGFAVVTNRNDPLVGRWKRKIKERDRVCQCCGASEDLQVHHISHWSTDPVNRINEANGVLLCRNCHALQHPDCYYLIIKGCGVS